MYIILSWWYDETIANAQVVCKDDDSGDAVTFKTRKAAKKYAKREVNGDWLVVEG